MSDDLANDCGTAFGPFRLFASERLLEEDGVPIQLGARAFDILAVLVERAGELVTKQELMSRVWPNVTVEEGVLRVHITKLRKVLRDGENGARYVINVPMRGYSFVASVNRHQQPGRSSVVANSFSEHARRLPPPLRRMVGRGAAVLAVSDDLSKHRFVTIHGPGGIGKTTVALAIAQKQIALFDGAVCFFDLAAYGDAKTLTGALASRLGLIANSDDMAAALVRSLQNQKILLILDSCELLVDAVAALAERLVQETTQVSILATSREALRVEGEHVFRLPALECPPPGEEVDAHGVLSFPAAQLFVERAVASGYSAAVSDADALVVGDICRRLDGLALAIELAAGGVGIHGVQGTASLLDNRLRMIWPGRRTALQRHQTLSSMIDWSHDLLSEAERAVFARLSVFVGPFDLDAATRIVADDELDDLLVGEALGSLVAKSLVSASVDGDARYRLLDTTRAYAQAKLAESDGQDAISGRHATYFLSYITSLRPDEAGRRGFSEALGNIRSALTWSADRAPEYSVFVKLCAEASQFLLALSHLSECQRWCGEAIRRIDQEMLASETELKLQAALGLSSMFVKGHDEEAYAALARAVELAAGLDQPAKHLRAIAHLLMYHIRTGTFGQMLELARQAERVSASLDKPEMLPAVHWMHGISHHFIGNQSQARVHLENSLQTFGPLNRDAPIDVGFDYTERARTALAQVLWLQGFPDQAILAATDSVRSASAKGEPITQCIALLWTTFVFLWTGDVANAARYKNEVSKLANRYSLKPYEPVITGMTGEILARQGNVDAGIHLLRSSLEWLHFDRYELFTPLLSCSLAEFFLKSGNVDGARALIDQTLSRVAENGGALNRPELLRIKGLILQVTDADAAAEYYHRAIVLADEQTALSWRLRSAMSLAQLLMRQQREKSARDILAATYDRFDEGFATHDLRAAKLLLDTLGGR